MSTYVPLEMMAVKFDYLYTHEDDLDSGVESYNRVCTIKVAQVHIEILTNWQRAPVHIPIMEFSELNNIISLLISKTRNNLKYVRC